jgi:ribosomal protein S18 acetylase RimI-like enzyme
VDVTSLGFRTDLLLLELSGSVLNEAGDHLVVRTPANPGFWWGNFLLFRTAFAPGATAARMDLFQRTFPDAKHVAFGLDTIDGVVGAEDELVAAGFDLERNTVMTATMVQEPARPNTDSEYRFLGGDEDWDQLVELSLVASPADAEGYAEFTRRKVQAERRLVEDGHGRWFGAFEGSRLQASLGLVSDGSGLARFQNVQTHPDDRNRGIASTLVHRASQYGLTELGARTLVMVADPEYLAIRLYRALGFADTEVQVQLTRPAP